MWSYVTVCQLRVGNGKTNWIWVWIEFRGVFLLWRLCLGYLRNDMAPEPQEAPSSGAELHPGNLLCKPWKPFLWLPNSNTQWLYSHIDQASWTSILWVAFLVLRDATTRLGKKYVKEKGKNMLELWQAYDSRLITNSLVTTSKAELWSRDASTHWQLH